MNDFHIEREAIKGNKEAVIKLLEKHEEKLYRIAYSYFHNEHDALDAYQECTYRCLRKIHTVKSPHYVSTWIVRVLINICHDMKKKKERIELHESLEQGKYEQNSLLELTEGIMKLPLEQQELIYLKYFHDMKNSEIAKVKKIPEGTVKSRLHSAISKLRVFFSEGGK